MLVSTWTSSHHIQHEVLVTVKLKLMHHLKPSMKKGGGRAAWHSQDFMKNQFSKKNSIFLVHSIVKNENIKK